MTTNSLHHLCFGHSLKPSVIILVPPFSLRELCSLRKILRPETITSNFTHRPQKVHEAIFCSFFYNHRPNKHLKFCNLTTHKTSSTFHNSVTIRSIVWNKHNTCFRGGRTRLPIFTFLAKFPIGLHMILQIQIKKIKFALNYMCKIILTKNLLEFTLESSS